MFSHGDNGITAPPRTGLPVRYTAESPPPLLGSSGGGWGSQRHVCWHRKPRLPQRAGASGKSEAKDCKCPSQRTPEPGQHKHAGAPKRHLLLNLTRVSTFAQTGELNSSLHGNPLPTHRAVTSDYADAISVITPQREVTILRGR